MDYLRVFLSTTTDEILGCGRRKRTERVRKESEKIESREGKAKAEKGKGEQRERKAKTEGKVEKGRKWSPQEWNSIQGTIFSTSFVP